MAAESEGRELKRPDGRFGEECSRALIGTSTKKSNEEETSPHSTKPEVPSSQTHTHLVVHKSQYT